MNVKSILITGVFGLASLGIASAKSYDFTLDRPTTVGTMELKPGEYHLKMEGSNAVFTPAGSSKSVTAPANVQSSNKKFDQTAVVTHTGSGATDNLTEIDLGGSTTKLQFGE